MEEGDNATVHKDKLRQKILKKRKERGEEDIDICPPVKITKPELSPDEIDKRERRKEQNRKAATKFRNKKKTILDAKQQERSELIKSNKELECKIADLNKTLDMLKETFNRHLVSGCCLESGHTPVNLGSNPDTSTVDPDTTGFNTTSLNPDFPGLNPDSLEAKSLNLSDVISDWILDQSPNNVESLTIGTDPHSIFSKNIAVASPHQFSVDCFPDKEFDMSSMNAQNDQISMFQYIPSQLSPVSVENEEQSDSWLPFNESLEQRSFTNL